MPGVPFTTSTSAPRSTRSLARVCATGKLPRYHTTSMMTSRPSTQPASPSERVNVSTRSLPSGSFSAVATMRPTRLGRPGEVCARARRGPQAGRRLPRRARRRSGAGSWRTPYWVRDRLISHVVGSVAPGVHAMRAFYASMASSAIASIGARLRCQVGVSGQRRREVAR